MRPIADLNHSAYDTLEFVKQHYPEMVQMYETIMAHLKVPQGNSEPTVITGDFTPESYMIKGKFHSVILNPEIITAAGYTSEEYNTMAKRAGLIYMGLYNKSYNDSTIQVPQFALVKPRYKVEDDDWSYYGNVLAKIPKAHSFEVIQLTVADGCDLTYEGSGTHYIYDFSVNDSENYRYDYETHADEYVAHHIISHNPAELQFNVLIGLGDDIKLPEVM